METLIILGLLVILFSIWLTLTRRKLATLEENVKNAMGQIGIQISSRQDMTAALTEMVRDYAVPEKQSLADVFYSRRKIITAASTVEQVQDQEQLVEAILKQLTALEEMYPELQKKQNYVSCKEAANSYRKMVHTSCLIYNDSVAQINRAIKKLPTSFLAGMIGFHQKEYLELDKDEENE